MSDNKKTTIRQNENSRFFIVHRNGEDEKFFGGFYNETECPGTENESFCWEMENWVDRPEDGAIMFKTLHEARDFKDFLEDKKNCVIILYGLGEIENFMLGSYWYPLKEFN